MTPQLSLLLLDFDGVLVSYDRSVRFARLAQIAGCTAARVEAALFGSGLESAYDSGELESEAYLQQLSQALEAPIDAAAWLDARVAACVANTPVLTLVERLSAHLPIAVLTNNGVLMAEAIARIVPSLFPALEGRVLCSGALGARKPMAQAYLSALAQLQTSAEATLFVDDLFVNVRGARACALHAETVQGAGSLRRVLKRYRLL